MAKLNVLFIIIFLAVLSLLAFFNKDSVNITVWKGVTFEEVPVIALIFISSVTGVLSMFIIATFRDARRFLGSWQIQRQLKKESKVQESYLKGVDAFFASRYEEAKELFVRIIENDNTHLNSLLRLGDIAFIEGDYAKAKEYYLMSKEVRPKNIEALLALEKVFESQKKWPDAIKYLDDILEIDDGNIKVLNMKRDIYEKNRKWEEIIDVQQKILKCKLSPEDDAKENEKLIGYKYELGRFYLETGAVDKAIKLLKGIVKSEKSFAAAYFALADAYARDGNSEATQDILMKGYEATSSMVFLARLEEHFIAKGEPGNIIDLYQKAIQADQKDTKLKFFLAKLYFRLEMIDHAQETIDSIDTTSFDFPELHTLFGSIYERRLEYEKAVKEFKQALRTDDPVVVPFCCSSCSYIAKEWSDRCPECREWNTFILDINEFCKIQKRQSSS